MGPHLKAYLVGGKQIKQTNKQPGKQTGETNIMETFPQKAHTHTHTHTHTNAHTHTHAMTLPPSQEHMYQSG